MDRTAVARRRERSNINSSSFRCGSEEDPDEVDQQTRGLCLADTVLFLGDSDMGLSDAKGK